jgi:hypothetical protein
VNNNKPERKIKKRRRGLFNGIKLKGGWINFGLTTVIPNIKKC